MELPLFCNKGLCYVIARRALARRSNLLRFVVASGDCFVVPTGLPRNDIGKTIHYLFHFYTPFIDHIISR